MISNRVENVCNQISFFNNTVLQTYSISAAACKHQTERQSVILTQVKDIARLGF